MGGYNRYNGNYYGDGSDAKKNSKGESIANDKTGATYKDTTTTRGSQGSKFARSDEGYKSNYDRQTSNANDYISKAEKSGNKSAADYGREQLRRLNSGEDLQYTWAYDGRGFGSSGNYGTAGREYSYNPYTGQSTGNLKMKNPVYDLMLDPQYDYGRTYFTQAYTNSPWLNELEKQRKLVDGETARSLAPVYADSWLRQNQYQPGNEFYTSGEHLYQPIQQQVLEAVKNKLSSDGGYIPISTSQVSSAPSSSSSYAPIEATPVNNDPIQPYDYNFNTLPTPMATPNFNPINIVTDQDKIKALEEYFLKLKGGLSYGSL